MERKIEEQLLAWKNKTDDRLPLIVNGARQVGKTYILRKFGEEQFKNVVYINLETNLTIASYFNDNIAPERLLRYLEASTGERIIPEETLIIFDEIQSSERALTALKYFCEETPEYHIAAAGVCWVWQSTASTIRFLWARWRRLRSIRWILRSTLGQEARNSLVKRFAEPTRKWNRCLMHCIRRQSNCIGNICLSAGCRPVSTPFEKRQFSGCSTGAE